MSEPSTEDACRLAAGRQRKAIVVIDLVESVRLLARHETEVIARWRAAVQDLRSQVLPAQQGLLVSHRGDGVVLAFEAVAPAVAAAQALADTLDAQNATVEPSQRMLLRTGIHLCEVLIDDVDAYGSGVNIAARLAAQARPGEIVLTAEAQDELHPALDVACEDLGELWLKHLDEPVRAYRVLPRGSEDTRELPRADDAALRPALAILPFAVNGGHAGGIALGELIADELIAALSALPELSVVSRLSTRVLAARGTGTAQAAGLLRADYVLTGRCTVLGDRLVVHAELHDAARDEVLEVWRHTVATASLVAEESPLVHALVAELCTRLLRRQADLARRCPLPNLAGYTLLLGGISLMHRLARSDVLRAHEVLSHLCETWPRLAAPQAWKARWHLFSVIQGYSADPARDRRLAFDTSARALDLDPQSSVAMAVAGSVQTGLAQDVDGGLRYYHAALEANPSDSFAWMLLGTAHAFKGEGHDALRASAQALRLSPLDPMHFLYDCHAAAAALADGDGPRALRLAERSLRANGQHLSTLRVLAIAQMLVGRTAEARSTIERLRLLDPKASVGAFLRNSASAGYPIGRRFAALLAQAGLPA